MDHLSYNRVGRRWHRMRGFRLNHRRFSVSRLRVRFIYLVRLLGRWKSSYGQALESLKKGLSRCSSKRRTCYSSRGLDMERRNLSRPDCRLRSYGRSNSFYSEAIADCLEFIKSSAVSMDDNSVIRR